MGLRVRSWIPSPHPPKTTQPPISQGMSEVTVISARAPCTFDEIRLQTESVLRKAGVKRAIVVGSWADGEADGFSELDLAVMDTPPSAPVTCGSSHKGTRRAFAHGGRSPGLYDR